jgi:hypothetical protein
MVNKFSEHLNSSHVVVVDEKIIKMNEEKAKEQMLRFYLYEKFNVYIHFFAAAENMNKEHEIYVCKNS